MSNNEFNQNTFPAEVFAASVDQGAAVVVVNTGLAEVSFRFGGCRFTVAGGVFQTRTT